MQTLQRIEQRLAAMEQVTAALAPLAEAAPGALGMVTDTFDALAARLAERGVDPDARLRSVLQAVEVSTAPRAVHGLATLVDSKLLEPAALAAVSRLAAALAEPGPSEPVGIWGLVRALREPAVQRALGFLLGVARELGRQLGAAELEAPRAHALPAPAEAV